MGETLDSKKIRLVKYITAVQDADFLDFLEELFERNEKSNLPLAQFRKPEELLEPITERIDLRKLLLEQNYKGPNKRRFKRLVKEINVQEPIEDLLALLTK